MALNCAVLLGSTIGKSKKIGRQELLLSADVIY